jgi:hypothetical protein
MKNQVKRFTQFINENYSHSHEERGDSWVPELGEWQDDEFDGMNKMSQCCGSEIDEEGYCTECGENASDSDYPQERHHAAGHHSHNHGMSPEELYEAKKKAQIEALKEVDKKFANLKPAPKKKGKAAEEEEEMEEAPKKGAKAKPAAKGMPFGKPAAKANPFAKKEEKPAAKGMPFGKPAAKPAAKPFGFQKKGANTENEM